MARIHLDIDRWPVPVIKPEGLVDDAELQRFFDEYTKMLARRTGSYALIIDLRHASDVPAKQRKTLTDFMKQRAPSAMRFCAGTALIFDSALMRALLTAISWVKKSKHEVRVFATVPEADAWARAVLARHSLGTQPVSSISG